MAGIAPAAAHRAAHCLFSTSWRPGPCSFAVPATPIQRGVALLRGRRRRRRLRAGSCRAEFEDSEKMHVPSDSFGGVSPERKASQHLQAFFTFVAVKVILSQLEGAAPASSLPLEDGGCEARHSAARIRCDYDDLTAFYERHPLRDADEWMRQLAAHNSLLARRVMEVRVAYASTDFEWDSLQRLSVQGLQIGNDELMRWWMQKQYGDSGDSETSHETPPRS
mmetsp:Transcript_18965/g.47685  ORF Transcript_18965/g.47685 Transcript_18965/m.47685 type:complete len:222 (-) Transcript_18965:299-964(-)